MKCYLVVRQKPLLRLRVQHFDLVVIGGGLVGASFAHAIAHSGLKVALIDKSAVDAVYNSCIDNRGIALAYTTKQILEDLDVWGVLADKANAIEAVHVSEQNSFGFAKLTAKSCGLPALGYVIGATDLSMALVHSVARLPNIKIIRPAEIITSEFDTSELKWTLAVNEQIITTSLLIAADGANSATRKKQNIPLHTKDYNQSALVTNLRVAAKDVTTAYERFCAQGILACLPFGQQQVKFIWTAATDKIKQLQGIPDELFLSEVQSILGFRLGKLLDVDKRHVFAISYAYAAQIYAPGMVLLGNAANTLHPVAAQGFNLGIRDALILSKVLKLALRNGDCLSANATLIRYADMRKKDHTSTRNFSNSLVTVFDNDALRFKMLRRIGLLATQFIPYAHRKIINQGLGPWI